MINFSNVILVARNTTAYFINCEKRINRPRDTNFTGVIAQRAAFPCLFWPPEPDTPSSPRSWMRNQFTASRSWAEAGCQASEGLTLPSCSSGFPSDTKPVHRTTALHTTLYTSHVSHFSSKINDERISH